MATQSASTSGTSTPGSTRGLDTAAAVVEGAADGLADGIEREGLDRSLPHLAGETAPIAQRGFRSERLRARLEKADEKVSEVLEKTKHKTRAIAESARRARRAPGNVLADVKDATKAYASGVASSLGLYAAAGLIGLVTLVLVTVGLVQGLNDLWGRPWGTFAVALLYGLVAAILVSSARSRAKAGKQRAKLRMAQARLEVQRVTEPVRQAFRREGAASGDFGHLKDEVKLAVTPTPAATPTANSPSRRDSQGRVP